MFIYSDYMLHSGMISADVFHLRCLSFRQFGPVWTLQCF